MCLKDCKKDLKILEKLRDIICTELPINEYRENIYIQVFSMEMSEDLCKLLKLDFKENGSRKKDNIVQFPDLETDDLRWTFLRGYFDGDGSVFVLKQRVDSRIPRCCISSNSQKMLDKINDFCNIKCANKSHEIYWTGLYAIKFLNKLYENKNDLFLERKYDRYFAIKDWFPYKSKVLDMFKYVKIIPEAITPLKKRYEPFYTLHLIKKIKEEKNIIYYDTCISIIPKPNNYFVLSALNCNLFGYELINDGELIDNNYSGNIIAKIKKIDKRVPELILPLRALELIPFIYNKSNE